MEDKMIIKYITSKKEEGLRMFIDTYGDYINTIVRNNLSLLPNYHEECLNDIFLSVWMNINNFDEKKNTFKNWVGVVSKYKTIDYKRKYLKEFSLDNTDHEVIFIDKDLLKCEIKEEVNALLQHLSEHDRSIFVKRYLEDLDIDTIAKEMNTKPASVYTRISRCKKKLKDLVNKI